MESLAQTKSATSEPCGPSVIDLDRGILSHYRVPASPYFVLTDTPTTGVRESGRDDVVEAHILREEAELLIRVV